MNKKFIKCGLIMLTAVLAGLFCFAMSEQVSAKDEEDITICEGVTIQGIEVGGLNRAEAMEAVNTRIEGIRGTVLKFRLGEEGCELSAADLSIGADVASAVEAACAYGHVGNILQRYKEMQDVKQEPVDIELPFSMNEEFLTTRLNEELADVIIPPKDASIVFEDEKLTVVEGEDGHELNAEETIAHVAEALASWKEGDTITIDVATNVIPPAHTTEELSAITDEIGTFETKYSLGDTSRNNNIANAASKVNGSVVYPGEEFDTMAHLVPFTTDNGWYYAGAYLNGEVISDIGGGICQLSTTLYNAVLRAELEVTERHPHSMAVGYVPLSADAALNEGTKNLRFVNNTETPIYIYAWATGGTIHVSVYGRETREESRSIEYENEIVETIPAGDPIETIDESQPPEYRVVKQSAHTGYVAKLWKRIYENGELVDTVLVNTSSYSASPERVTIGKPADPAATEAPADPAATEVPADPGATEAPADPAATEAPADPVPTV